MLTMFYEIDSVWQVVLLVISQITVLALVGGCILDFRHRHTTSKQFGMGVILLILNIALYVLMQISSSVTDEENVFYLQIPYLILFLVTILSLGNAVWKILYETRNSKVISNTSIKESFDNLPTGVCFFNEAGLPVLCNHAMHRFSFAVCGKDVQFITDLQECFLETFEPVEGTIKDGNIFTFFDGSAWNLEVRSFIYEDGNKYTQYIAFDVTDLQRKRVELTKENEQLSKVQAHLKRLSANVVAITREEEILNAKIRVHDEMGRCLMVAQKYLKTNSTDSISESDVLSWKRAVSMIKYNNETVEEDMMWQIRKTCESVKLRIVQTGSLPKKEKVAYVLTCAIRECVTNAVYYAGANELYVDFTENEKEAVVVVANNGKQPDREIVEGGGLSTLRRRVECIGGTMCIQSVPEFRLTVIVPKEKGDIL